MKRCALLIMALLMLTGCAATETFETLSDEYVQPVMVSSQPVYVWLPEDAAQPALESGAGETLYLCDGYTVTVHTIESGDIAQTLRQVTGFPAENLTLLQTKSDGYDRVECVWTAAGEGEDHVGRLLLVDDGAYHYVLTAMAPASKTQKVAADWEVLFDSFYVGSAEPLSTGS